MTTEQVKLNSKTNEHLTFRHLDEFGAQRALDQYGWVVLQDVAPSEELVEALLSPIGKLMPQYGQRRFWAVEAKNTEQGTSLGDQELRLHSELAEFSHPPEYVSLYAQQPAESGGYLRLLDIRPLLASLSTAEIQQLLYDEMTVKAEGPIAERYGEYAYTCPILSVCSRGFKLRFDQCFIDANAPESIRKFRDKLLEYSHENTIETKQNKGSLLVWDNRYILHGRSAFSSNERRLWRCCIRSHQVETII